jgi:hypothetical protein
MRIFSTRGSRAAPPASGEKSPAVGEGIPISPTEQEQLVRELVEQQLELLGLGAKAKSKLGSEESLLDRVGQLEARLERAEALLQDAGRSGPWRMSPSPRQKSTSSPTSPVHQFVEESPAVMKEALFVSRSRSPRDTHIALFTARGSPAVVETFLKDGSRFRTLEPPEMQCTPRAELVVGTPSPRIPSSATQLGGPVMGCVLSRPCPGEDEPPCEESPRSRPLTGPPDFPVVPRLALQASLEPTGPTNAFRFKGPKWGAPLTVFGDDASSQAESEHLEDIQPDGLEARRRPPPWSREPDEGNVEDNTAAWLWQVDLPVGDGDGLGCLGIEVHCKDDVDKLVVTSVIEGRVAKWNLARPRQQLRVEIGDQIVGVGSCEGSTAELLEQLGRERSRNVRTLKCRRDVGNWYRLKATAMGYVEQPGRRLPGKTF